MFVAHVVHFAETRCERFVVVRQLGEHVQWLDAFSIIIDTCSVRAISPIECSVRPPILRTRSDVGHGGCCVFINKQVTIVAAMPSICQCKIFRFRQARTHPARIAFVLRREMSFVASGVRSVRVSSELCVTRKALSFSDLIWPEFPACRASLFSSLNIASFDGNIGRSREFALPRTR